MPTKQKKSLKITFIFFRQNQFLVKFSKKGFYFFYKTWAVPMYASHSTSFFKDFEFLIFFPVIENQRKKTKNEMLKT